MQKDLKQYTLSNDMGLTVSILNYGAIIQSIKYKTETGNHELVLGFKNPEDYLDDDCYLGAIVGRFCNRIAKGQFSIDGKTYLLPTNQGENHLHGGIEGFSKKYWQLENEDDCSATRLKLSYRSDDNEEGYPGKVITSVTYLLENDRLIIDIKANTDKTTPVNLTGHSYFNLNGNQSSVKNHWLQVNSNQILEMDENSIPTGDFYSTDTTSFDCRDFKQLAEILESDNPRITSQLGLDHNYVLKQSGTSATLVASVKSPVTNIQLDVFTNKPGMQIYTGNYLSGNFLQHGGICLEPQYYPDSPNHKNFPDSLLKPGEEYHHQIIYQLSHDSK